MTMNLTAHEQLFFDDGYRLAKETLKNGGGDLEMLPTVAKMYEAIDELIDSLSELATKKGIPVNCQKGCAWCCHQPVYANTYELEYLTSSIKNNFEPNEIQRIKKQANKKDKETTKLSEPELRNNKSPCPLLKNKVCTAYKARPMACRIYLSTKVASCVEFFRNPTNKENYPALLDFPLRAGRMMNEGFMAARLEAGIETTEFRLEEGLKNI